MEAIKRLNPDELMNGTDEFFEVENAQKAKKKELDITKDFRFFPSRLRCTKHPSAEIEYCNSINNTFYCKQCRESFIDQDDTVLTQIAYDVQKHINELRLKYVSTKQTLLDKLTAN